MRRTPPTCARTFGEPIDTDPKTALAGAQLPFGGVKGSSIALMIELLAGPLLGDQLSFEAGERDVANTVLVSLAYIALSLGWIASAQTTTKS